MIAGMQLFRGFLWTKVGEKVGGYEAITVRRTTIFV